MFYIVYQAIVEEMAKRERSIPISTLLTTLDGEDVKMEAENYAHKVGR